MVKFLHTADWQIGMRAAHVGAVGKIVRAERLISARRVIEAAKDHQVDFVMVAGDTFEDNAVDRVLVQKVADILGSFSKPVFIIPGNHDPLVPGSVWEHPSWGTYSELHLLTEAKPVAIGDAMLYPCPLFEKHSRKDPTQWIHADDDLRIAIGIGHGTVSGVSQTELDYPIAREAAENAGLDYLGLGHWHSFSTYPSRDGVVRMAYSGTHETTKFGERDSGNALVVEISERGSTPILTSLRTGGLVWTTIEESLTESGDLLRLRQQVESLPDGDRTLIDLRIGGILHHDDQAELVRLDELIRARFLYGRTDTSRLLPNPSDHRWLDSLPPGVMQAVARRLQSLSDPAHVVDRPENGSPEIATRALLELYRIVQGEVA